MKTLVHCAGVINPLDPSYMEKSTIGVDEGKIVEIIPGHMEAGEGQEVVSWGEYFVVPGFFDCHEHVTLDSVAEPPSDDEAGVVFALRAASVCANFLRQGVTTVRDAGARGAYNIMIKKAMKQGLFEGPDLFTAGHRISRTGYTKWAVCLEADGPETLRKVVRQEEKRGADFIKLMTSDVMSGKGSPYDPTYSFEEIKAAVEEAHDLGLKVGVHAYGGEGVTRALRAGVDSIEHGSLLTEEEAGMMADRGAFLVMTYMPTYDAVISPKTSPAVKEKARMMIEDYQETLPRAKEAGVRVVCGGDSYGFSPVLEASALIKAGFTNREALAALTVNGAPLCGMADKGLIRPGFKADLLALEGNPLEDIEALERVRGVIKGGGVVGIGE
ncbi:MAG: amidohydrolase family protein [Aminivibrio sp.]|jgi:imidazolonepropionase-like amidohydrolase|nr:amidohydrolase family protein [Synergistaceae bacterium]